MQTIHGELRTFIVENFLFGLEDQSLADDESFLDGGILDSTGVLELIAFLEKRFQIAIADEELMPANLDSIDRLTRFVERKLQATQRTAAPISPAGTNEGTRNVRYDERTVPAA